MDRSGDGGWRAERRVVTAMFVDLVGSTALVEALDAEDARELLGRAIRVVVECVEGLGGTVKDLAGDGVLALFGAPVAHEDDAERAVLCGLRVVDLVARQTADTARELGVGELAARVGIETGSAVLGPVGGGARVEYGAVGDAVNTASRLQGQAAGGSVLVGAVTRAMVEQQFSWGPTRQLTLKGKARPVQATVAMTYRGGARLGDGVAALVGRDAELDAVEHRLHALVTGHGGVVVVLGEPGVGKSRLVAAARKGARKESAGVGAVQWLEAHCRSYAEDQPLLPFRHLVLGLLGLPPDSAPDDVVAATSGERPIAEALSVAADRVAGTGATGVTEPEGVQRQTFAAVSRLLAELAAACPTVLVLEDVHWADPTTVALVESLVTLVVERPLLLVVTGRLEEGPLALAQRLTTGSGIQPLRLDLRPLADGDDRLLLRALLAGATLPSRLETRLLVTTAGNPLFLEEQVRGLVTTGALARAGAGWQFVGDVSVELAPTVQRAITARVDRLPEELRDVLLAASVLGSAFDLALLEAVAGPTTRAAVTELVRHELLEAPTEDGDGQLRFRHALVQEATNRSLLRPQRSAMHARAAEALLSAYAGREHQVAAVLGQHLAAAGQPDAATPWLLSAARQAASSYANEEAAALAATALDLFDERTFVDEAATARRTDLHVVRGRALHRLARYDAAAESLRAALAHISARDPLAVAELQLELAAVLRDAQLWEAALELLTAAETALGDLVKTPDGFDTWLKIQLDRCAVYYWYEAGGEHLGLLESVRADVEQRGTLDQQMDFYDSLRTAMWRRSGYAPWPGAMELDRLVYEHQRRDPDPLFRAWAEFSHGVGLLWAGEVDLAGRPLSIAAAEAERLEDAQLRSRALTYLMVVARQRRDVDGAMALVAQVDQAARDAGLQEYQALATATRAWAAYARGDLEGCLAQGRKALAQGDAAPMRYPFDWMSCLPLLAVALQRRDTPTALRLVGRMLDEHQQPLPADVARPLHAAVDATEPDAVAAALTEAVEAARANGRL